MTDLIISIVIPTFNRAELLRRSLESLRKQSVSEFEVVIIDDGSTDGTKQMIESLGDDRLKYFYQPNRGRSVARNRGVEKADGQYVLFLDSDDEAREQWVESLASAIRQYDYPEVVSCAAHWYRDRQLSHTETPRKQGKLYYEQTMLIRSGTFAIKRDCFMRLGGYRAGLEFCEHTEFSIRLTAWAERHSWRLISIDEPLVKINDYGGTLAGDPRRLAQAIDLITTEHHQQFQRDPKKLSQFYSIGGVNAVRCGQLKLARRFLWQAWRAHPASMKSLLRWAVCCVPLIASQVWNLNRPALKNVPVSQGD